MRLKTTSSKKFAPFISLPTDDWLTLNFPLRNWPWYYWRLLTDFPLIFCTALYSILLVQCHPRFISLYNEIFIYSKIFKCSSAILYPQSIPLPVHTQFSSSQRSPLNIEASAPISRFRNKCLRIHCSIASPKLLHFDLITTKSLPTQSHCSSSHRRAQPLLLPDSHALY